MEIDEFQDKLVDFSLRNFGPHHSTGYRNLLGVMEELGELSHAHLKQEQGIRRQDYEAKKRDAIGDIIGFLVNYCDSQGYQLSEILDEVWEEIKHRDWKSNPDTGGVA